MKQEKLNPLEREYEKYCQFVYSYAEQIFNDEIKPYLDKHNLTFLSGNGTYFVGRRDEKPDINKWFHGIDTDNLPKHIKKWLELEIPGMENNLGSLMPDYK